MKRKIYIFISAVIISILLYPRMANACVLKQQENKEAFSSVPSTISTGTKPSLSASDYAIIKSTLDSITALTLKEESISGGRRSLTYYVKNCDADTALSYLEAFTKTISDKGFWCIDSVIITTDGGYYDIFNPDGYFIGMITISEISEASDTYYYLIFSEYITTNSSASLKMLC